MSKGDKKQRNKAKREAKRREQRRRESVSPIKRLADAKGEVECWISEDDFEGNGQMQLFIYKRAGGLSGLASFLVDRGVVGLKDAWTRMDLERGEFEDILKRSKEQGIVMRRVEVEVVRKWVAGGVRWAHENGMRLPKELGRTALLMGGVGDWESADVSRFVKEFAGHPEDLRQRLIGEPLETYLERRDIDFVFNEDAPYMDQETGKYSGLKESEEMESLLGEMPEEEMKVMMERVGPAVRGLVEETEKWLAGRKEEASGELVEAWGSTILASMLSKMAMPDAPDKEVAEFGFELLQEISGRIEEERAEEYDRAVEQVMDHLETDPMMMQKAIMKYGIVGDEGEELDGGEGRG